MWIYSLVWFLILHTNIITGFQILESLNSRAGDWKWDKMHKSDTFQIWQGVTDIYLIDGIATVVVLWFLVVAKYFTVILLFENLINPGIENSGLLNDIWTSTLYGSKTLTSVC